MDDYKPKHRGQPRVRPIGSNGKLYIDMTNALWCARALDLEDDYFVDILSHGFWSKRTEYLIIDIEPFMQAHERMLRVKYES